MVIITGAAGFIASYLLQTLNEQGIEDIIIVDDFSKEAKANNYSSAKYKSAVERKDFIAWFHDCKNAQIDMVIHLGARTDTTEFDSQIFDELNLQYSKDIWQVCSEKDIPLIYASSAATYGLGEQGYADDETKIPLLQPLNPYGQSKQDFDVWVLQQHKKPPFWYGLKFFNVYGPNEYHKGRMASVVFHAFEQIKATGAMKLFKSHHPDYTDGGQLRDFIYVKDIVRIIEFLMLKKPACGIYNAGTGLARTFNDLAKATFDAMNIPPNISFIDTPIDIRDKYQYFTEATMEKLKAVGYDIPFYSLEDGVEDYVVNFLEKR
jgi:ADP-L-glycero-D-manno-heptose 6-epimerase